MSETVLKTRGGQFLLQDTDVQSVFTPEDLTDEHKMIAKTALQFVEKEVEPHREEIEKQDFDLVVRLLRKAGDLGLLAHSVPAQYDGLGLDKISKGLVGEIVGRTSGYGVAHSNHTCIATLPITYFGTQKQKTKYLPKLASGEYIGAYCLTEPEAGSDALSARTTAVLNKEGTHYILNGTKIYITNAIFSDTFIVYAKVDGEKFTAFIVEKDYPGLSLGPEEKKMGIKGSSTRSVIMEDCLVPVENVLGEIGKGHLIALNVLNLGRFNLGSACMGGAKYGIETAILFTKERKQFRKAIADFAATKEKLAKMAARVYAAESIQYRTAGLLEEALGGLYESEDHSLIASRLAEFAMECSICKVYGSETLDEIADEALQLHGGAGFIQEYGVEQMYRDSRINRIFEGTNEINRLLLPTQLLRKAGKGEVDLQLLVERAYHQLQASLQTNEDQLEPLDRIQKAITIIRNVFLTLLGSAFKKFGMGIGEEQETLMKLSNIAIGLFAIESATLRTMKAEGSKESALKLQLTETILEETLSDFYKNAKELISSIYAGEERKQFSSFLSKLLLPLEGEGGFARNRQIAEVLLEAEKYSC